MAGPLSNLRVLDLTRVLAGPWCTQMLADLGADVVKVERPRNGDDTRHWGPPWVKDGDGEETADAAYFLAANRNKRSIAIDLASVEGQALVRELALQSDILVENYKVGDLTRYGLSYAELRKLNPRLVYCSITGYGQDGPYADRPGYDFIFQGEGGLMSINGEADDKPGGGPMKTSIAVTDILTGLNAAIAILAAVESRHSSGTGQHIDLSLLDTMVHFGSTQIVNFFATGEIPRRCGNESPSLMPYQTFPTADGHVIVACGNDGQYRKFCALMGREDLTTDALYSTVKARNVNRRGLQREIDMEMRKQTSAYWLAHLSGAGVPNGPINDYEQVFQHPQVVHRELRVDLPHASGGSVSTVRNPIRLSDTPIDHRLAPPQRGQHTREILAEILGKDAQTIQMLLGAGVIESVDGQRNAASSEKTTSAPEVAMPRP